MYFILIFLALQQKFRGWSQSFQGLRLHVVLFQSYTVQSFCDLIDIASSECLLLTPYLCCYMLVLMSSLIVCCHLVFFQGLFIVFNISKHCFFPPFRTLAPMHSKYLSFSLNTALSKQSGFISFNTFFFFLGSRLFSTIFSSVTMQGHQFSLALSDCTTFHRH